MNVVTKKLSEIKPYERNPRRNDDAVEYVANSLKEFGWKQPIVIDKDGVIVAGHTRYKAATRLLKETADAKWNEVPCVIADDLTESELKAYRLADNKTAEMAFWDFQELSEEMATIPEFDMRDFGFSDFELGGIMDSGSYEDDDTDISEYEDDSETNGRVIIVYKNDEEKNWVARLLHQDPDKLKVVYSVDEFGA